jgi:DNA-binding MarR family transcriptional regulator
MTTIPAAAEFGYTLAMANDAATAVVRQQLAERGVKPERWGALQLIAKRGPALSRTALSDQLARSRALSADLTRELLAELETNGLIRGDKEIELTPEGQALYRSLNEHITAARDQLLSHLDRNDIETTVHTLQAITERAANVAVTS